MSDLNCKICLEMYEEEANRYPRTLPGCGHTICELCVNKLIENSKIQCPFDRIESVVPEGNTKYLKKDFAILEAIQEEKWKNKIQAFNDESESEFVEEKKLGILCDENKTHIAVFYCAKCDASFCKRCSILTHSSNVLASHRIVKVTEKPEPLLYCPQHSHNIAELLCKEENCEEGKKLMCLVCQLYGVHKNHISEIVEKVFENEKAAITESLEGVYPKKEALQGYREHMSELSASYDKEAAGKYAESREMLIRNFKKYHEKLEIDEKFALSELDRFFDDNKAHCDSEILSLNSLLEKIDDLEKKSDMIMKYGLTKFFGNREEFNGLSTELQQLETKAPEYVTNGSDFKPLLDGYKSVSFRMESGIKSVLVLGDHLNGVEAITERFKQKSSEQYAENIFFVSGKLFMLLNPNDFEKARPDEVMDWNVIYMTDKTNADELTGLTAEIEKIRAKFVEQDEIVVAVNGVKDEENDIHSQLGCDIKYYNIEEDASFSKFFEDYLQKLV